MHTTTPPTSPRATYAFAAKTETEPHKVILTVGSEDTSPSYFDTIQSMGPIKTFLEWSTPAKVAYAAASIFVFITSLVYFSPLVALAFTAIFIVAVPTIFWMATSESAEAKQAKKCCKIFAYAALAFASLTEVFSLCRRT